MSGQATEYFGPFCPHQNILFIRFHCPARMQQLLYPFSFYLYIYIIILFPTSTGCIHTHILPTFIGHLLGPGRTDSVTQIHCMCSVDRILNTQNIFLLYLSQFLSVFHILKLVLKAAGRRFWIRIRIRTRTCTCTCSNPQPARMYMPAPAYRYCTINYNDPHL